MDEKTYIANPIYDVVFRYLMEDNKVAKLFLSAVMGESIEELVFSPTTYSRKIGDGDSITVIRMDFSAKIREENGTERLVIIELQKAKYYHQTIRFRRYLGKQYQNPENIDSKKEALPVYPIYIIGDAFTEHISPVIKIKRSYIDVATQEIIHETHPFIEALTHDSIVIQIPYLKGSRRTTLEHFLSIFDQSLRIDTKGHVLALKEEDYPERYRSVVRRLNKAWQSPKIEEDMDMEDEVLDEFNKKDAIIEAVKKEAAQEKQRAEQEKQSKYQLIRNLYQSGQSVASIAQLAQMTKVEIESILNIK
ncbi:MAG: hypothetical protein AAF849_01840 [Bacteroidota bacterium]